MRISPFEYMELTISFIVFGIWKSKETIKRSVVHVYLFTTLNKKKNTEKKKRRFITGNWENMYQNHVIL